MQQSTISPKPTNQGTFSDTFIPLPIVQTSKKKECCKKYKKGKRCKSCPNND